jgi:hypothetical protein
MVPGDQPAGHLLISRVGTAAIAVPAMAVSFINCLLVIPAIYSLPSKDSGCFRHIKQTDIRIPDFYIFESRFLSKTKRCGNQPTLALTYLSSYVMTHDDGCDK